MPPKNIDNHHLYIQTPEGYKPLNNTQLVEIESTAPEDFETFEEIFLSSIQATINVITPKIKEIIQILTGVLNPYEVNEMLHPRKKPRGSIRRRSKTK